MKDEFLFLSKLSESLNVNVLISPGLTDENCLQIADCVRKKLNDLRTEVEQWVLKVPRKKAIGYLQTYQYYLQKLMDALEQELMKQKCMNILNGDESCYFSAPQYTLLKVINRELEYLLVSHRAAMDLSQKMPAASRIGFYSGFGPEATVFLEKVRHDLDDKVLANIICDFVRSFKTVQCPYGYTFSDRDCVLNLFSMLIPVLNCRDGVDKSTSVRDILMAHGFNFPAFVSYCTGWFDNRIEGCRANTGSCLAELGRIQHTVFKMCNKSLSLKEHPLLHDHCNAWIKKQTELCTCSENFDARVKIAVQEMINRLKIKTSFTVKELGVLIESLCEQNLFESSKKQVIELFATMFSTDKSEEISEHSFSNAMYCRDEKVCATVIGYIEESISIIKRRSDL